MALCLLILVIMLACHIFITADSLRDIRKRLAELERNAGPETQDKL